MENHLANIASIATALASLAFATSISPGPNNLMLMASGARAGFKPTVPHILGVSGGLVGLLALAYFGVGALVAGHRPLLDAMAWASVLYMVWLAIKLLRDRSPLKLATDPVAQPTMSFVQAATFQLINPKAWAMAVSGATMTLASGIGYAPGFAILVGIFAGINLPCVAVWAAWGSLLRGYLTRARVKLVFDLAMAVLILATAWAMAPAAA